MWFDKKQIIKIVFYKNEKRNREKMPKMRY